MLAIGGEVMKHPPEIYTRDEIERMVRACSAKCPTGQRNRALIILLWRGMLRVSEALALRPKDLDLEAGTVRVLHGKGDKARTVGLDPQACAVIQVWLSQREKIGMNGVHPLFCTLAGEPIKTSYVRSLLPRLGRKAGVEKRVHAHGFRHTGAVEMMDEGVPVGVISKQLGHSDIATTARYLDHIAPKQVIETMRGRSW